MPKPFLPTRMCALLFWVCLSCPLLLTAGCGEASKSTPAAKKSQRATAEPEKPDYLTKTPEEWLRSLRSRDPRMRGRAADALAQYGESTVGDLCKIVENEKAGVERLWATRALGLMGHKARAAVPSLVESLGDTAWEDRDAAAETLGRIDGGGDTQSALVRALGDSQERVRRTAATALGRVKAQTAEAVDALAKSLQDDSTNVQAAAAEALLAIGPAAQSAVPALRQAAASEHAVVAQSATDALTALGASDEP
jgi:HEAT repeat protein